jgi:hypothetical protein
VSSGQAGRNPFFFPRMKYRAGKRHVRGLHSPGRLHTHGPLDRLTLDIDECVIARRRDGWRCVRVEPEHVATERHDLYRHPNFWADIEVLAIVMGQVLKAQVAHLAQQFASRMNSQGYSPGGVIPPPPAQELPTRGRNGLDYLAAVEIALENADPHTPWPAEPPWLPAVPDANASPMEGDTAS